MGRVYRADHIALDAQVAVKILNPEMAADQAGARRFHNEARAASRLRHPNTIAILDFGQSESGVLFLVMELLRGRTLQRIIQEEAPLAPKRAADLIGQALAALDEAHAVGIVHRDFKPENIFVETLRTGREHVKVLDFGIAKLKGDAEAGLTSAGSVCGTPDYMSPEQVRGTDLDLRSDIYAAGIVLYESLLGVRPFDSSGPLIEVLTAHLNKAPPPLRERRPELGLSAQVEAVCLKALAKAREDRHASCAELKAALEAAVAGATGECCSRCGAQLPASARFCSECGAVLRPTSGPSVEQAELTGGRVAASKSTPAARDKPAPTGRLTELVGRDEVLERLASMSQGAMVLAGGEGVGKSAVAHAWARREEARSRRVIVSAPDASGARTPWHPLRVAVGRLLNLSERPALTEVEAALKDQPQDVVGVSVLLNAGGPTSLLPLDVRRRECGAAAVGVLRRASASFLFEDVHGYDEPSRVALAALLRDPGKASILCTADGPSAVDAEIEVVRLQPLSAEALAPLKLPEAVVERTGGFALRIEHEVRARAEGAAAGTLAARLDRLPAPARQLLEVVAVSGWEVPVALVAQVVGSADVGKSIAELATRGFFKTGAQPLEIVSPTLRREIYQQLAEERRTTLHRKVAELLEARGGPPIVVAHHGLCGRRCSVGLLARAGDAARQGFDDRAAIFWYKAAVDRCRELDAEGEGDELAQVRIALKLGVVLRYGGDTVASELVIKEALENARRLDDRPSTVQAYRALARLASGRGDHDRARRLLVQAIQEAFSSGDAVTLAELYLDLADALSSAQDLEGAYRELEEGLLLCTGGDGAEAQGGPEPVWRMVLKLADLRRAVGRMDEAVRLAGHALRHAERTQSPLAKARVHAFLGLLPQGAAREQQAVAHRRAAIDVLRRVGDRRSTAELLIALADPSEINVSDVRAYLLEADALANQVGWNEGVSRSRAKLAALGGGSH
jgi:serine/threonine-protein kinase